MVIMDIIILFLILCGKPKSFAIKYAGSCTFLKDAIYQDEEVPFYSQFDERFHFCVRLGIDVEFWNL